MCVLLFNSCVKFYVKMSARIAVAEISTKVTVAYFNTGRLPIAWYVKLSSIVPCFPHKI